VLGVGQGANFLASDIQGLLAHTRTIIPLHDGDIAELTPQAIRIVDLDGQPLQRAAQTIDWDPIRIQKGGYRHFMRKEIDEQASAVPATMQSYLTSDDGLDIAALDQLGDRLSRVRRITFVACGTSWHAGLAGKFYVENLVGLPVDVDYASEFRYRRTQPGPEHLIVPITQSGETMDTLGALRDSRAHGSPVVAVCNVPMSSATREADATILTQAGPEIGVASTKAFTTQLTALYMLALDLAQRLGVLKKAEIAQRILALRRLRFDLEAALEHADRVREVAVRHADARDMLFLGRGRQLPHRARGGAEAQGDQLHPRRGLPGGGDEARAHRAHRQADAGGGHRHARPRVREGALQHAGGEEPRRPPHRRWRSRTTCAWPRWPTRCSPCRTWRRTSRPSSTWCRCSCWRTSWPSTAAATSTSRAIWPRA
jgi:glucosamine--fructose-6-phosphate aminotransferase (isomerizing)